MFLFSIAIGILAISLAIGSVSATDQTITNTTDGGLKTAISNVSDGDTITLKNGIYYGDNNRGITINHNLKIVGEDKNKVILDAQNKNRFFEITKGVNVTLVNLTFKNGLKTSDEDILHNQVSNGGAIFNNGNLSVKDSIFTNNQAVPDRGDSCGGAIYNGGTLSVSNSNFNNNSATTARPTSYSRGGAIYNGGNLSVSGSNFTINKIVYGTAAGAAIYNSGNFNVFDSNFINNQIIDGLWGEGGAAISNLGNLNINGSKFTGNQAGHSLYGGAIFNGANLNVSGSIFINNTATRNSCDISNTATFSVTSSNFTGNQTKYDTYTDCNAIINQGSFNVSGCIFSNNVGYAIYVDIIRSGTFSVSGSVFSNNKMGAISSSGSNFSVSGSTFTSNSGNIIRGNNFSVSGSTFTSNSGNIIRSNNFSVSGSTFTSNSGNITSGNNFSVSGSTFTSNSGNIISGNNFSVSGSTFTSNSGNIISGNNFSVSGSTFTSNSGDIINGNNFSVRGSKFINNRGHSIIYSYGSLRVINSIFTGNQANWGVIFNYGTLSLSDSSFTSNKAIYSTSRGGSLYTAGAVNNLGGIIKLNNVAFKNNIGYIEYTSNGKRVYKIIYNAIENEVMKNLIGKIYKTKVSITPKDGTFAMKKPKITYSVKESSSGRQITKKFTVKNKGTAAGSLSGVLKISSALKYVKTIASTSAYYKYNKARKALTLGVKNLGAGKSTTLKVILRR